jgi:hypothetical protein
MILCTTTLAVLLVIGGLEKNPGPGVEAEKILQVVCSGCDRNLKSGTQCNTCGRWVHNSCGNVKAQVAESGKWTHDKCRSERVRLLEKLQNALLQIDDLTRKNSYDWQQLEGKLAGGIWCRVIVKVESAQCLVTRLYRMLELKFRYKVECFPGIRMNSCIVIEKRDLGNPDTVVIHVGTTI